MKQLTLEARLNHLFAPASIAVIGASSTSGRFSNTPLANLRRFAYGGRVYPVSIKGGEIEGYIAYKSLAELPEVPDHAVVVVRPDQVPNVLQECRAAGVPSATVVASGFAETGDPTGVELQNALREISLQDGPALCGPNTLGVANFNTGAVTLATTNLPTGKLGGNIAVVSQSGGIGFTIVNRAWHAGVGVGYIAVAGNEAALTIPDYIEYFLDRPDVKAVLCYMEAIRHPEKLLSVAAKAVRLGKPIIALRAGTTESGQRAAAAHTGALAAVENVTRAVLKQYGILEVTSFDALVAAGGLFGKYGTAKGRRIGVYAQGGGMAVVLADKFTRAGLELPMPTEERRGQIQALLPDTTPGNPFDSGGQFLSGGNDTLIRSLKLFAENENFDAMAYGFFPSTGVREKTYCDAVAETIRAVNKPHVVLQYRASGMTTYSENMFRESGILACDNPDAGIEAMSVWAGYAPARIDTVPAPAIAGRASAAKLAGAALQQAQAKGGQAILEHDAKQLLAGYGLPVGPEIVAGSIAEAGRAGDAVGYPAVAKILSIDITHRAGTGTIQLNLQNRAAVEQAYDIIVGNARRHKADVNIAGVLIQRQSKAELELFGGLQMNPQFGPILVFGIGGILVEVLSDVVFRRPPVDLDGIEQMIDGLKGRKLLDGYRGLPRVRREDLLAIFAALSAFAADHGDMLEAIDLNPMMVQPDGRIFVADALIIPKAGR